MLVSRISPAPSVCILRAHATASRPVGLRPPWVNTSQRGAGCRARRRSTSLGVDGHDDALRAVAAGSVRHQLRILHGGGVDADLVGAGIQQAAHVVDRAHAAADGQRDEHLRGHRLDDVQDQVALVRTGGDVEKGEFVGALLVVAARDFDRVAGVAQADEVDALDHAAAR